MLISIIIPTYNEAEGIGKLITFLKQEIGSIPHEILIADGQSTDDTSVEAVKAGAIVLTCPKKGRAKQLNFGAKAATGDLLYFLHADTFPPKNFGAHILEAVNDGVECGCFRLSFDWNHWFLSLNSWFTRFRVKYFRWGDQSIFIKKDVFWKEGGFRDDLKIMEDQVMMILLLKKYQFEVLPYAVKTSARKYRENGPIKLQLIFTLLQTMYHMGIDQEKIISIYKKLIQDKRASKS